MTYDLSVAINDVRLTTIGKCLSCNEGLVNNLKIMWVSSDCQVIDGGIESNSWDYAGPKKNVYTKVYIQGKVYLQ